MMAFNTVAPFLFQNRLGITTVHYGWLILLISSGYIFGGNFNNFLLKIFQAHKVLITSLILILTTSLIMLLFALSHIFNIYVVAIPMFLVFFAFNMAYPICAAGAMDPFAKQAGVASALSTFTIVLGGLIGSAWIAILPEQTQLPLATIILIAGSGSLLGYLVITPKYNNFSIKEKT